MLYLIQYRKIPKCRYSGKLCQERGRNIKQHRHTGADSADRTGRAFALYATVTVPQYMASQELINEVIVTSDETGTQAMTSKANVELKETDNIVTVTPQPASLASQNYGYDSKSGSAYTTASKPRTGDETETALYIVLGIFAIMSGVSAFCYRKTKKQQK